MRRDTLCDVHGDDFCTEGAPSALDEFDQTIIDCFKAKIMPRVGPCEGGEGTGFLLQPDPKHFQNLAEPLKVSGVKRAPTPTSKRDRAHVERCAGTTRQSGTNPVQEVRLDLHVPRTRPVRRPVHGEGPRARYAGADAVEHGKAATTGSGPLRHASHRHRKTAFCDRKTA